MKNIFLILLFFSFIFISVPSKIFAADQVNCLYGLNPQPYYTDQNGISRIKSTLPGGGIPQISYSVIGEAGSDNALRQYIKSFTFNNGNELRFALNTPLCLDPVLKTLTDQTQIDGLSFPFNYSLGRANFNVCNSLTDPGQKRIDFIYTKPSILGRYDTIAYICKNPLVYQIESDQPFCNVNVRHDPNTKGDVQDTTWAVHVTDFSVPKYVGVDDKVDIITLIFDKALGGIGDKVTKPQEFVFPVPQEYRNTAGDHTVKVTFQTTQTQRYSNVCSATYHVLGIDEPTPTITPIPTVTPIPTPIVVPDYCKIGLCATITKCNVSDSSGNNCNSCPRCQKPTAQPSKPANLTPLCNQISNDPAVIFKCLECVNPPENPPNEPPPFPVGKGGIWTAIGCLPTNPTALINGYVLAPAGLGIAGGIAFLYFLYGAFLILTSAGNAEQVNHGKEIMTSAIAGLLLILFSIFILRVAAHDILGIPGFS